jgi:hypothetical protein
MTCPFIMLPVISIGEDLLFPWRQLAHVSLLLDLRLEDQKRIGKASTVKWCG